MSAIELRFGDALSVLRTFPDHHFHALITDPPFTAAGGSTNGRTGGAGAGGDTQFFDFWLAAVFAELRRVLVPSACGFVFCDWRTLASVGRAVSPDGNRQREEAWRMSQAIVWDRESIGLGSPFRNSWEMIAFIRGPKYRSTLPKDLPNIVRHRYPYGRHEHHGAEKPVTLVRQLIQWAEVPAGGRVLDPFAGSGTALVACRELGVAATGIEVEPPAYSTAQQRARAPADPAIRPIRLAQGRCPECGSEVEWHLTESREGASAPAHCSWSAQAYLSDAMAREYDAGRQCQWKGRIVRGERGATMLREER